MSARKRKNNLKKNKKSDMVIGICEGRDYKLCETSLRNQSARRSCPSEDAYDSSIMFNLQTGKSSDTGLESPVHSDIDIHKHKCEDHTDENQSFYCEKHDVCICGRCVFSNHSSCLEMVFDLNNVHHNAEHMKKSVSTLQVLDEEIDRIMAEIEENRRLNDKCISSCKKEINDFHKALVQKLIFVKTKAEKESDNLHKQNKDVLDEMQLKCKEHRLAIRQQNEYLKTLEHKKYYRYLFVELKRIEKKIDSFKDKNVKCQHQNHIKEYEFARNLKFYELIGEDENIGRLTVECDGSDEVTEMDDKQTIELLKAATVDDRMRGQLNAEKTPDEKANPMRDCLEHEHVHCIQREYDEKLERLKELEECLQEKEMTLSKQEERICFEKEKCESMIRDYAQRTTKLQKELFDSVQQMALLEKLLLEKLAVSEQKCKQLQEQGTRITFEKEQYERAYRVNERKNRIFLEECAVSEKKVKQLQEQEKRIIFQNEQYKSVNRANEQKIKKLQVEFAVSENKIKQLQEQEKRIIFEKEQYEKKWRWYFYFCLFFVVCFYVQNLYLNNRNQHAIK